MRSVESQLKVPRVSTGLREESFLFFLRQNIFRIHVIVNSDYLSFSWHGFKNKFAYFSENSAQVS